MAENTNFFGRFTSIYTDKSINGWVRGVAWIGTAAVLYILGDIAYKSLFKSQAQKDAAAAAAVLDNSIKDHQSKGMVASYPLPSYASYADTIYNSLNFLLYDQYSSAVDALTSMKNDLDVELLQKAFGTRPAHTYFGLSTGSTLSLFPFVNQSFDNRWYGLWNQDKNTVNDDWASKGIKYQL